MDSIAAHSLWFPGAGTAPTRIPAAPAHSNVPCRAQHQLDELLELGTQQGLKQHPCPAGGPGGTDPASQCVAGTASQRGQGRAGPGLSATVATLSTPPAPPWARPEPQHQPGQALAPATGSLENAELCFAQGVGLKLLFLLIPPVFKSINLRLYKLLEVDFSARSARRETL